MKERPDLEALEARLARALRESEAPALDARWKAAVMDSVRAAARRPRPSEPPALERLVRNAVLLGAAAVVVAIFVVGAGEVALDPSLELARMLAGDPQGLLQLFLVN